YTSLPIKQIVCMVQKEVAEQLCATHNQTKQRGRLSIFTEFFCKKRDLLFSVSPENFSPQPKVFSSVIHLEPKQNLSMQDLLLWDKLEIVLRKFFSLKRKSIQKIFKIINI